MNKKIALVLLLSTLYVGTVHVGHAGPVQPGAFPPPSYADLMGLAPETAVGQPQPQETQPSQPIDYQNRLQQWEEYRQNVARYNASVMWYNQQQYPPRPVTAQPSAQQTPPTDSHHKTTVNINCCVVGDNCCVCTSSGNDECNPTCPVRVAIAPVVNAALNLFTCGAADADEDLTAQQLRELQKRNPGMRPVTATLLPAGKPRVVTKEHKE